MLEGTLYFSSVSRAVKLVTIINKEVFVLPKAKAVDGKLDS